jgi:hypothetical protein
MNNFYVVVAGHPDCFGTAHSHIAAALCPDIRGRRDKPGDDGSEMIQNDRKPL